ncbi:hypothetical protein CFP56_008315 [Quercus suber]|uniref:Uncharacterized protein n=1 Tax=Quercus suber TaxID=58331 RepID=A0AAW0L5H7_QUESU
MRSSYLVLTSLYILNLKYMVAGERSPEHTLVQQPQYSIHKPCTAMHKDVNGKTKTETGNVVGRSSYFLLKSENQKDLTNNQEKVKANGFSNVYENTYHIRLGKTRTETGKVVHPRQKPTSYALPSEVELRLQRISSIPATLVLLFTLHWQKTPIEYQNRFNTIMPEQIHSMHAIFNDSINKT